MSTIECRSMNRWFLNAPTARSVSLQFGESAQKAENPPVPVTADLLRQDAEKRLESQGYKAKKPKGADRRPWWNVLWLTMLAATGFGSFWGISGLVKGPDRSQYTQEQIIAMDSVRGISCRSFDQTVDSIPNLLRISDSFKTMPQAEQQRVINQTQQRMKDGHNLIHAESGFYAGRTFAAVPLTIISLILGIVVLCRQSDGDDKTFSLIKNTILFPAKKLGDLRTKQFEVIPLSEFEQNSLMKGVEALAKKSGAMAERIQAYAAQNPDLNESLIKAFGKIPTAADIACGLTQKTMEKMFKEELIPRQPWTQTRKFNEWILVKNMLETAQEIEQTGFILDPVIQGAEEASQAASDTTGISPQERERQTAQKQLHANLANHTIAYYHTRDRAQHLQGELNQVTQAMETLVKEGPADLELRLVALHQREHELNERLALMGKEEKLTLLSIQRSRQQLSESSSNASYRAEQALKRALGDSHCDLDQMIEKLEVDKAVAQASAEQRIGLTDNSLAEIKAHLELKRRLTPESTQGTS